MRMRNEDAEQVLTMENVKIEEKNTDELILIVNKEADDAEREQAIA